MRKATFTVPREGMTEFAEELSTRNFPNSIVGTTEEEEIIIEVPYDKEDEDEINELEDILEKIIDDLEEEEEAE